MEKQQKRKVTGLLIEAGVCLLLGAVILLTCRLPGFDTVWQKASGAVRETLKALTRLLPFSLAECCVAAVIVWVIASVVICIVKLCRRQAAGYYAARFGARVLALACAAFLLFELLWGVWYSAKPLTETLPFEREEQTTEMLARTTYTIALQLNELAQNGAGDFSDESFHTLSRRCEEIFAASDAPFLQGAASRPKPVLFSVVMSYLAVDGIFFPFTSEANVNRDLPLYALPAVMSHEVSHLMNVAREDEANFSAFLVCMESGDGKFQYSALSMAYRYCLNALYRRAPETALAIHAELSEAVRSDYRALSDFYAQFETPVATVSSQVNDLYLKAQGQTDGVASYGYMVDLVIAWYRWQSGEATEIQ